MPECIDREALLLKIKDLPTWFWGKPTIKVSGGAFRARGRDKCYRKCSVS